MKLIFSILLSLLFINVFCATIQSKEVSSTYQKVSSSTIASVTDEEYRNMKLELPGLLLGKLITTVTETTTAPGGFLFTVTKTVSVTGPASTVYTTFVTTTVPLSVTTTTTSLPGGFLFTKTVTESMHGPSTYTQVVPTTLPGVVTTKTTTLQGGFWFTKTVTESIAPPPTITSTVYINSAPASTITSTTKLPGGFVFTETITKSTTVPAETRFTVTTVIGKETTKTETITETVTELSDPTIPFPTSLPTLPIDNSENLITFIKDFVVNIIFNQDKSNHLFDFIKTITEESQRRKFDDTKNKLLALYMISQLIKNHEDQKKPKIFPFVRMESIRTVEDLINLIAEE